MLRRVHIPEPERRVHAYPHQLSGGMRQRVMIAMALSCNPKVLIADEPTTALDVTIQAQILDLMRELQDTLGTAIILITHDMGVVAENADRVVVMYAGRKVEEATADELFEQSGPSLHARACSARSRNLDVAARTDPSRARLNEIKGMVPSLVNLPPGCSFAPRCALRHRRVPRRLAAAGASIGPATGSPAGTPTACSEARVTGRRRCRRRAGPLLEVDDLKKHFPIHKGVFSRVSGHVYAVDGVSFHIDRGETLGLVGESGCGKSTVGRTLLKLLEPTDGTIRVDGEDITELDREQMLPYRRRMQMIYQDPYASLNPRMTAGEIVGEPLIIHGVGSTRASAASASPRLFERVGPAARADELVSARVLRRPAPAHRHRARAGARARS